MLLLCLQSPVHSAYPSTLILETREFEYCYHERTSSLTENSVAKQMPALSIT